MMYDIAVYCSRNYEPVLSRFLPSWLRTNVFNIHVYCDHGHNLSFSDNKVLLYPIFGCCPNRAIGCVRKAEALQIHMCQLVRSTILLDVDCFVNRDLGLIFDDMFDIGVSVNPRSKAKSRLRNISGGLLFVNNTTQAKTFIREWVKKQRVESGPSGDQASLVKTVSESIRDGNCSIKEFSEDIYNCHPYTNTAYHLSDWIRRSRHPMDLDQTQTGTNHILHFAHKTWKRFSPEQILGIKQNG